MSSPFEYEVRNPEIETKLRQIAKLIAMDMPPNWGFSLTIFEYGQNGNCFYISSAQRGDMIKMLEELLARLRRGHN